MFPTFPNFSPLKLDDRERHNKYVTDYEPYSDILFTTLHIWWNLDNKLSVSILNNNLIIYYHLPFDKENSGYSIVGENDIDGSINTIFNYFKEHHMPIKLVHVPEFVIAKIHHKDSYKIVEEADYAEYILSAKELYELKGKKYASLRYKINRFHKETEGKKVEVKSIDLSNVKKIEEVLGFIRKIEKKYPPKNDHLLTEHEAIKKSLAHYQQLGLQNMALYVDDELCGIAIFDKVEGHDYYIGHHMKVDYDLPYASEYLHNQTARKALEEEITYINIEMDLGIENLRNHKMKLKPVKFFKKFQIYPEGNSFKATSD
ncbi:MAG TPA: phosphatidylglycerol lysyltransferase domain-containing protein [Candidatus Saccharimonadales bacterium]|nr:phosphatidylglycerol lysyltransferase domain-containing protein [Candidatus Saccharimonadales bacterium]